MSERTNKDKTQFVVVVDKMPTSLAFLRKPPTVYGPFDSQYAANWWCENKINDIDNCEVVPLIEPTY